MGGLGNEGNDLWRPSIKLFNRSQSRQVKAHRDTTVASNDRDNDIFGEREISEDLSHECGRPHNIQCSNTEDSVFSDQ